MKLLTASVRIPCMSKTLILLAGMILTGPWAPMVKEDLDRAEASQNAPEVRVVTSTDSYHAPTSAWLPVVREIAYSRTEQR